MSVSWVVGSSAGLSTADASTVFYGLSTTTSVASASEGVALHSWREAGTFDKLITQVSANDIASATSAVVTVRKNQVNTILTVSYGTSQTGVKEDTVNSFTTTAPGNTNDITVQLAATSVSGAHSVTLTAFGMQFTPTTAGDCVSAWNSYNGTTGATYSAASTNSFISPGGSLASNTTEANNKLRIRGTFTASNLIGGVLTNARTTTTTITSRKNGAAGSQTISWTSTQTGGKEDTSNTDSLVAGDDFNYQLATGTGTGNIVLTTVQSKVLSTASQFIGTASATAPSSVAFNTTRFIGFGGDVGSLNTTEANVNLFPETAFTCKELTVLVTVNSIATSATLFRTRVNGANGTQSVSFAAAETGLKSDSVNTDSIPAGSTGKLAYSIVTPNTSGSITFTSISSIGDTGGGTLTPSVTDAPTGAEVTTGSVQTSGSVTDSASGAEVVTMTRVSLPSVLDSASTAEVVTPLLIQNPSVTDSVTAAEVVTASPPLVSISVTDAGTVAEVVAPLEVSSPTVSDSGNVTEIVTASGLVCSPTTTDSSTIAEVVTATEGASLGAVDVATAAEVVGNVGLLAPITVSESTSAAEVVTSAAVNFVAVVDSGTVGEVTSLSDLVATTVSDPATLSEEVTQSAFLDPVSVSDSTTTDESVSLARVDAASTSFTVSDAASTTEDIANSVGTELSLSDTGTVIDAIIPALATSSSVSDSATGAESSGLVTVVLLAASDTATTAEVTNGSAVSSLSTSDSASVDESADLFLAGFGTFFISETGVVSETTSGIVGESVSLTDTASVEEVVGDAVVSFPVTLDALSVTESDAVSVQTALAVVDAATTTESSVGQVSAAFSISDSATTTEVVGQYTTSLPAVSDTATSTESLTVGGILASPSVSENVPVAEVTIAETFVDVLSFGVSDSVGVDEVPSIFVQALAYNLLAADSVVAVDASPIFFKVGRFIQLVAEFRNPTGIIEVSSTFPGPTTITSTFSTPTSILVKFDPLIPLEASE